MIVPPGSLSGASWWHANQAKYPNSSDVLDLDAGFVDRVLRFIKALTNAGANVHVSSTRRNRDRAYLMHYSWAIAHGAVAAKDVPKRPGVNIDWDHGDADASKKAAQEMMNLFHMAHDASLTSNHITGKAIDMDISWKGDLLMPYTGGWKWRIDSLPRTGAGNKQLHQLGSDGYQIFKLKSDAPHWSIDGR